MAGSTHHFSLSPVQYGMVVESLRPPRCGVYVLQMQIALRHPVEVALLEQALRTAARHQPCLRTGFAFDGRGAPSHVLHPDAEYGIELRDLSPLDPAARGRVRDEFLEADLRQSFDYSGQRPPMRLTLLRYGDADHELVWSVHHALLDGRSWAIVLPQVFGAYDDLVAGRTPEVPAGDAVGLVAGRTPPEVPAGRPYSDYVRWREERDTGRERAYWSGHLAGAPLPSRLPLGRREPPDDDGGRPFGALQTELAADVTERLYEVAAAGDVSPHNYVQAAWSVLLHQATGATDLVIGTTRACRSFAPDARERVGLFLNTLPLRIEVAPHATVRELVADVRRRQRPLREFEHAAAGEIRRWAGVPGGVPLFESAILFENYEYVSYFHSLGGAWELRDVRFVGPTPFAITLSAYRAPRLLVKLEYHRRLYADEAMGEACAHVKRLLEAMVAAPDAAVATLPRLPAAGAAGASAARFWADRLSLLAEASDATSAAAGDASGRLAGAEETSAAAGEAGAPLPGGDGERSAVRTLAAIAGFLARLAGDGEHEVGVRRAGRPSMAFRLPPVGASCPLARVEKELARCLASAPRGGDHPIVLEIVDELRPRPEPPAGAVLLVQVPERGGEWRCVARDRLVSRRRLEAFCGQASAFLDTLSHEPNLGTAELVTSGQRQRLVVEWNDTARDYPADRRVHELIAEQAARRPDATAVSAAGESLTYGELQWRVNALAARLAARGVGSGSLVGLHLERSAGLLAALLGVLASGAAYVPLDPIYPRRRIEQMVESAALRLIVTDSGSAAALRDCGAELLVLDDDDGGSGGRAPERAASPDDVAYVIFTSGSTGRPKGVRVRHRGLTNLLCAMRERPGFTAADRMLAVTTVCFDISYLELFLPLVAGGQVHVCPAPVAANGVELAKLVRTTRPTAMQATPATWRMLIASGWSGDGQLTALCGGERLTRDLADALLERCGELWNMYGPTETTIWSSTVRVLADEAITIGRPIANTRFHVLDGAGRLLPPGVPGELHIGGDGVAAGYLHEPELTRARFVPDPVAPGAGTVYRTGDVVRQLRDGRVEYIGRDDDQVKVNGFRIELAEVERALRDHRSVAEAVVTVRDDPGGGSSLVGYVVPAAGTGALGAEALRAHLRELLPAYMVPRVFVSMSALPLTPNGKVDRRALPDCDASRVLSDVPHVPPRSAAERQVAAVWREVLGLRTIGVDDSFFDLGGDSLLLMQLVERLREDVAADLTHLDVFEFPTIRALARHVADVPHDEGNRPPSARPGPARSARLARLSARRRAARSAAESG